VGKNHTENAVDGTEIMLRIFKAQFFVSTCICGLVFVIILLIILAACNSEQDLAS